jgi:uncharacterized protein
MKNLIAFTVGLLFAIGLGISGMTQVHIVKGFLDFTGDWNPALMGVMAGAIMVHALTFQMAKHRTTPLLDTKFYLPTKKDLDFRLLLGAALFGIGWGWGGICPGPGIVAAVSGHMGVITFVISMLAGMGVFKIIEPRIIK